MEKNDEIKISTLRIGCQIGKSLEAFNASMNPKSVLITIIEMWLQNTGSHSCRPIRTKRVKKGSARYQRTITTGLIGISQRRREDWPILRAAKQMGEKSKETRVTAAKSWRYHRERCVGSSWILIIKGGAFSTGTTVYLPDKFTERIKHEVHDF